MKITITLTVAALCVSGHTGKNSEELCPKRHSLNELKTPNNDYACNICNDRNGFRNPVRKGTTVYGCTTCNWHACEDCHKRFSFLPDMSDENVEICRKSMQIAEKYCQLSGVRPTKTCDKCNGSGHQPSWNPIYRLFGSTDVCDRCGGVARISNIEGYLTCIDNTLGLLGWVDGDAEGHSTYVHKQIVDYQRDSDIERISKSLENTHGAGAKRALDGLQMVDKLKTKEGQMSNLGRFEKQLISSDCGESKYQTPTLLSTMFYFSNTTSFDKQVLEAKLALAQQGNPAGVLMPFVYNDTREFTLRLASLELAMIKWNMMQENNVLEKLLQAANKQEFDSVMESAGSMPIDTPNLRR